MNAKEFVAQFLEFAFDPSDASRKIAKAAVASTHFRLERCQLAQQRAERSDLALTIPADDRFFFYVFRAKRTFHAQASRLAILQANIALA